MATRLRYLARRWKECYTTVGSYHQQLIHSRRESIQMVKQFHAKKFNFYFGASLNIFGIGFDIGKYGANLTIGFIWLSIEW
jgi:hypothetical protein